MYYKKYSNILARLKDLAKRFYYHHKLNECKDSPTQTWKILRSLLPSKNNNLILDSITVNSSSISDLNQIAEEFNNHFANVGKSLANSLKDNNTNDESIYLKHPCLTSIYLQPTTPLEIMVLINSLKLNHMMTLILIKNCCSDSCISFVSFSKSLSYVWHISQQIKTCKSCSSFQKRSY